MLVEAVVVGLIASVAGLAAGVGVAVGPEGAAGRLRASTSPPAASSITSGTVIISLVAGLGVSVASAFFPARRAAEGAADRSDA